MQKMIHTEKQNLYCLISSVNNKTKGKCFLRIKEFVSGVNVIQYLTVFKFHHCAAVMKH